MWHLLQNGKEINYLTVPKAVEKILTMFMCCIILSLIPL